MDLAAAVDMLWGSTFARFVTGSNSPVGTVGSVVKTVAEWVEAVRTRVESRVEFRYGQVT